MIKIREWHVHCVYSTSYLHNLYKNKNKINVDIKFSAHDALLEKHSSGTLKIERLERQIIKSEWEK